MTRHPSTHVAATLGLLFFCSTACDGVGEAEPDAAALGTDAGVSQVDASHEVAPPPEDAGAPEDASAPADWRAVREVLEASDIESFTLVVGDASGERFVHERGDSNADRVYELASGSKWPAAAALMQLVEDGVLSLDDRVHDHVPWWTSDEANPRSRVTLRDLLSFTSGFVGDALAIPCVEDPDTTLDACAREIYDGFHRHEPGTVFFYGPPHLQVAGAMAEHATGRPWNEIFADRLTTPLGLTETRYVGASPTNPRVAGGAVSSAREYGRFLQAMLAGQILATSMDAMRADYTADGVAIEFSPIPDGVGEQWHYAFGSWRECASTEWRAECDAPGRLSSAGAYGFYPWMDVQRGYWAVLAMRLRFGREGRPTVRAVALGHAARPHIERALGH